MRFCYSVLMCCLPLAALAEGFAVKDLRAVVVDHSAFAGGTYDSLQEEERIIIACESCDDLTSVTVTLGRSTDGTEERFRSGETTVTRMEEICKERAPSCTLNRLDVGTAVGWVTQYDLGETSGSTAVLFQDGDLLTIRSLSSDRVRVGQNMQKTLREIAPGIVGTK